MLVTVTLNPCIDHAIFVETLAVGDTNRVARVEKDAGGKGLNVSRVYAELGGKTTATGFLGGSPAAIIRRAMQDQGVLDGFVNIEGETRVNVSVEDNSATPPTTFNEKGPLISESEMAALVDWCRDVPENTSWAVLGGSMPPGVSKDALLVLGRVFTERKVRVVLDADGDALVQGLTLNPSFIKPNNSEAGRLLGIDIETDEQAVSACQALYDRIGGGDRYSVISRGKEGAVMTCAAGTFIGRSPKIMAKSSIGSGDSMIAGILWALDTGHTPAEALQWGLASGAATATTDGREIGRRKVIELLLDEASVESR